MRLAYIWKCLLLVPLLVPAAPARGQDPAYADALGHAMQRYYAGSLSEAQGELSGLINLGYADPRLHYFRGLCAWQSGRTADAQRDFAHGAELEQADAERAPEVSKSLQRVQGTARRALEGYRANVRLAMLRQRDARRLAHYGLTPNQLAANLVASAPPPAAEGVMPATAEAPVAEGAPPIGGEPAADSPDAAAAMPAEGKPADDPFAAPAADTPAAPPADDPFAPAASAPQEAPPAAEPAMPAAAAAEPAPPAEPAATEPPAAAESTNAAAPMTGAAAAAADTSTPEGAVAAMIAGLDQPQSWWDLLPAQHQADVKELINQFGTKMDAELWDRTFVVLNKLVRLGKEKRDLILKQPALQAIPVPGGQNSEGWDQMMQVLEILLASEIRTVEGLKTLDPPQFLASTGGAVVGLLAKMPAEAAQPGKPSLAQLKAAKVSAGKTEGDTAAVTIAVEGQPPTEVTLKRVDGKWLPASLVDGWAEQVAGAKAALEKLDVAGQKPQGMALLQVADGMIDQLLGAKDEAAFNAALSPIMALIGQFGGQLPAAAPAAPAP